MQITGSNRNGCVFIYHFLLLYLYFLLRSSVIFGFWLTDVKAKISYSIFYCRSYERYDRRVRFDGITNSWTLFVFIILIFSHDRRVESIIVLTHLSSSST
jgi:hypothetical protein